MRRDGCGVLLRASGPIELLLLKGYLDMLFDLMLQSDTIENRAVVNTFEGKQP